MTHEPELIDFLNKASHSHRLFWSFYSLLVKVIWSSGRKCLKWARRVNINKSEKIQTRCLIGKAMFFNYVFYNLCYHCNLATLVSIRDPSKKSRISDFSSQTTFPPSSTLAPWWKEKKKKKGSWTLFFQIKCKFYINVQTWRRHPKFFPILEFSSSVSRPHQGFAEPNALLAQ